MEIKAEHLRKEYGSVVVIDDISFSLEKGVKVGLVGANGSGKSTLLKILAGEVPLDSGEVTMRKGLILGYMPQDTSIVGAETVQQYIRRTSGFAQLEADMATSAEALVSYERRDGYTFDNRMKAMLDGLGLETVADQPLDTLSSGQKSKVFMTGMLLSDPDVLLLDEPTNNLDLPALLWFEEFLARINITCLVVSHDRLFLDHLVSKVFEIDWHTRTLSISNGTYSDYLARKRKGMERQLETYEAQQEEIARLTEAARAKRHDAQQGSRYQGTDNDKFVRGFKRDRAAGSGKAAKALEKRIELIDRVERPVMRDALRINLEAQKPDGSRAIVLDQLVVGYPSSGFNVKVGNLTVDYGSRIAVLGLNGTGKSTFLKTIGGELPPIQGSVKRGTALIVGNFTQEHHNLPREETIAQFLSSRGQLSQEHSFALLKKYGFLEAQAQMPIKRLSPGGRARLLFALFSSLSVNVLLLDEPTNHLDVEALDALEEMLPKYSGTVILVSHDRDFLRFAQPTDTYLIEKGHFKRINDLSAYIDQAARRAARLLRRMA